MKSSRTSSALLALVLLLAPTTGFSAPQWCQTKVSNLYIGNDGGVVAQLATRNDYVQFCNVASDWKNVSSTACLGWVSLLRSAVSRNADIIVYYSDVASCSTIPTYHNAPAPSYIMLQN
jgi:hypothetical protein